jgi:uncharacterized membrane protein YfcA
LKTKSTKHCNPYVAILVGITIGLLSGLTGTGGGIFLSPIIVFLGWTTVKSASGTAAAFILFNSIAGLLGNFVSVNLISNTIFLYSFAVFAGVLLGTTLGIKVLSEYGVKKALGLVIVLAGFKFILT